MQTRFALAALAILLTGSGEAHAGEIVVRVVDNQARRITQPWVVFEPEEGDPTGSAAADDGVDKYDSFAGDRLWVILFTAEMPLRGTLILTDGAPRDLNPYSDVRTVSFAKEGTHIVEFKVEKLAVIESDGDAEEGRSGPTPATPDARDLPVHDEAKYDTVPLLVVTDGSRFGASKGIVALALLTIFALAARAARELGGTIEDAARSVERLARRRRRLCPPRLRSDSA